MLIFSKGYMTSEALASCGLTVLMFDYEGLDKNDLISGLAEDYSKLYVDKDIVAQINLAYKVSGEMVRSLFNDPSFTDEHLAEVCKRLIKLILHYTPEGKSRGFLRGTFFNKNSQPINDVTTEVQKLLMVYYLLIKSGKVKL